MSLSGLLNKRQPALLALADGSVFSGVSIGAEGETVGEVVFNTAMTGYQEILTDPSYCEQIITLTYPHIGNVGVNPQDNESDKIWASGLVIRELSPVVSNWRGQQSLEDFLRAQNVVAIAEIDTRRLTRLLREKGAQNGCIIAGNVDPAVAIKKAQAYAGLEGKDLVKEVTTKTQSMWQQGSLRINNSDAPAITGSFSVVAYDFGVKHQILRLLVDRGCQVTLVPASTPAKEVLAMNPDGVFLSNGPGDPAACGIAIENIKRLMEHDVPLFGICMGFQLLAQACGAKTVKMKFGHHGANHPVIDMVTKQVMITSQNHSFAVDEKTLPEFLTITHRSLFDNTLQGIAHNTKPIFAFQGHPEASPGPHDIVELFDRFVSYMHERSAHVAVKI